MRFRNVLLSCCVLFAGAAHAMQAPAGSTAASFDPTPLQREVLAAISGETEITPGVKLANRFTPENKQAARDYLTAVLKRFGLEAKTQPYGTAGGVNLYAILPATTSNAESIVFGAHYDTVRVAPGANDDGSGVAAVIAVAQAMTKVTPRSCDMIFAFFDEEERGLAGSRAFAQMLKDENRPIFSVHTIDQMGWDSNHNRAIELEIPYDGAEDLYTQAAATTPFIHKAGDTYQTIDFDYLASITRLIVEVMRELVQQPIR